MVHFSMFSLIIFVAVSIEQLSSLHTIILKTKHKQSNTLSCITIKYIFLMIDIRYVILLAINTHIDCANNSKSVFGSFSKQQQGSLKVCLSAFSVSPILILFIDQDSGNRMLVIVDTSVSMGKLQYCSFPHENHHICCSYGKTIILVISMENHDIGHGNQCTLTLGHYCKQFSKVINKFWECSSCSLEKTS